MSIIGKAAALQRYWSGPGVQQFMQRAPPHQLPGHILKRQFIEDDYGWFSCRHTYMQPFPDSCYTVWHPSVKEHREIYQVLLQSNRFVEGRTETNLQRGLAPPLWAPQPETLFCL